VFQCSPFSSFFLSFLISALFFFFFFLSLSLPFLGPRMKPQRQIGCFGHSTRAPKSFGSAPFFFLAHLFFFFPFFFLPSFPLPSPRVGSQRVGSRMWRWSWGATLGFFPPTFFSLPPLHARFSRRPEIKKKVWSLRVSFTAKFSFSFFFSSFPLVRDAGRRPVGLARDTLVLPERGPLSGTFFLSSPLFLPASFSFFFLPLSWPFFKGTREDITTSRLAFSLQLSPLSPPRLSSFPPPLSSWVKGMDASALHLGRLKGTRHTASRRPDHPPLPPSQKTFFFFFLSSPFYFPAPARRHGINKGSTQ